MTFELDKFRAGIFNLSSARFGKIAVLMIQQLYGYSEPPVKYYNLYDASSDLRIEVGFSRAMNKPHTINKSNVVSEIYNAASNRKEIIDTSNLPVCKFTCNIQQLKLNHFDILYYGIFFNNTINIYRVTASELPTLPGFNSKQHESSVGEAQMNITEANICQHKEYLVAQLSYHELFKLLS